MEWTLEQILFEAISEGETQTIPKNVVGYTTGTVRAWDIRRLLIDLQDGDPELLVRRRSILVKIPPLRRAQNFFFFVPDGALCWVC